MGDTVPDGLEPYGFSGGTYPSPNSAPNRGCRRTPTSSISSTGGSTPRRQRPWCTTVSLVNPHDVSWWPNDACPTKIPRLIPSPANFESADGAATRASRDCRSTTSTSVATADRRAVVFGPDPHTRWARCLDLYLWLQQQVDTQIGRVLDTLASRPDIDRNTVVVFTSDHGDYGGLARLTRQGRAGLRRVDPGTAVCSRPARPPQPDRRHHPRTQFTSSVDLAPAAVDHRLRRQPVARRGPLHTSGRPCGSGRDRGKRVRCRDGRGLRM